MIARSARPGVAPRAVGRARPPAKAARAVRTDRKRRVPKTPTAATAEVTSDSYGALPVVDAAEHILEAAGEAVRMWEIVAQVMAGGKAFRAKQPHISSHCAG